MVHHGIVLEYKIAGLFSYGMLKAHYRTFHLAVRHLLPRIMLPWEHRL